MKSALLVLFLCGLFLSRATHGAPSLPVTKPPVSPLSSWTGPPHDPQALEGQWFYDYSSGTNSRRTNEFYDNLLHDQGGGFASYKAVFGRVVNLQYDTNPPNNLIGFDVIATISNDVPALSSWIPGTNSHGETSGTLEQHENILYGTKLCVEFAISHETNLPPVWLLPYVDLQPYVIARNEDQLAWYCWSPDNPENHQPFGNYYVPAWDFGEIPPGAGVSRILQFAVSVPGMDATDFRRLSLELSENSGADVLFNRTTSLKISTWLDVIPTEFPYSYPAFPARSSNCSVFHNIPEPAGIFLIIILLSIARAFLISALG